MEDPIALTIKSRGKNKSGLRVEQRDDGHYYVSKVPRGFKGCSVGDRVLEINGVSFPRFKNEAKANELIDTFQLQIIPIDPDDGMETTDDDFDFGSDLEDVAASVPAAGLPRAQRTKASNNKKKRPNGAGLDPKKGPGRRESVEYIDDTDSEHENIPKASKTRAVPSSNVPQRKAPPTKGPGRRESVEYLDDDDESGDNNSPQRRQQRSVPSKPGPGRREVVEHLDDDDDTEDGANVGATASNNNVPRTKNPPPKGPGRRESVEYLDDDDESGDNNSPQRRQQRAVPSKPGPGRREVVEHLDDDDDTEDGSNNVPRRKNPPPKGPGRRESVEYLDDDDDDEDDESGDKNSPPIQTRALLSKPGPGRREVVEHLDDDDDTEDGAAVGTRNGVDRQQQANKQPPSGGRRRETVEYVDDDDTEDEDDADDDTDDDEDYEEVTRQQSSAKPRNVPGGGKPAPAVADDDEVSDYDGDAESQPITDDEEDDEDDDDDDDDDYEEPQKPLSASSLRHSMARKQDSRRSLYRPEPEAFERSYTSKYNPMDRWMVTVNKEADEDVGLSLIQYKSELFITEVETGPFFKTALDKGDKVLSINGKKVGKNLFSVTEAEELMEGKTHLTIFVLRPDTERDLGYKWVMENC